MIDIVLPAVVLAMLLLLWRPAVRDSVLWRATVTPLASIIGSGFLISGPLLTHIAGVWAPLGMLLILLVAFATGAVIRFNILHSEPLLTCPGMVSFLQRVSDLVLGIAYIVSVAFYVRLLASFVLRLGGIHDDLLENTLTTLVLVVIALVGWLRGLGGLEKMEKAAVTVKLAIIAGLLVGLGEFDFQWLHSGESLVVPHPGLSTVERWRFLAGLLLIVQGFETSRYLGSAYSQSLRVRSMRNAQWLASAIYLLFICLGLPLLMEFHSSADETAIIALAERIAAMLPVLIVVAAAMSQFSAAVADTVGAGGLFSELSANRISPGTGYVCLIIAAVMLVWSANVFEIVTLASRFFAVYYTLQCLLAIATCRVLLPAAKTAYFLQITAFSLLAVVLLLVVIFAIPVA